MKSLCLIFVALCLCLGALANFPDDPKPCKYGDIECLTKTFEYFIKEKNQGDSSINFIKIDPLEVKEIAIKQNGQSPVNIDLTLQNTKIYGLSKSKVAKLKGFGKDMTQRHEIVLKTNHLYLVGDYVAKGKILLLPITGNSKCNVTMINANIIMKFSGSRVEKDDGTYMKIDKFVVDADPERVIYQFDHLLNGDKALSDNMNQFLNDNWAEIFNELKPELAKAFGQICKGIIAHVFTKYPYDKFFIE